MKVAIESIDLIALIPESDAERAILTSWEHKEVRKASTTFESNQEGSKLTAFRIELKKDLPISE